MRTDFRHVWRDYFTGEILVQEPCYALDDLQTGEVFEGSVKRLFARGLQALREARFDRKNATLRLVNPQGTIIAIFVRRGDRAMWRAKGRS